MGINPVDASRRIKVLILFDERLLRPEPNISIRVSLKMVWTPALNHATASRRAGGLLNPCYPMVP